MAIRQGHAQRAGARGMNLLLRLTLLNAPSPSGLRLDGRLVPANYLAENGCDRQPSREAVHPAVLTILLTRQRKVLSLGPESNILRAILRNSQLLALFLTEGGNEKWLAQDVLLSTRNRLATSCQIQVNNSSAGICDLVKIGNVET